MSIVRYIKTSHAIILAVIGIITLNIACANIGTPDGGAYDETPPRIVRSTPRFGAVNSSARKIILEFDENIKLQNAAEKVIVSPPQTEQPEIDAQGKRITIELQDTLIPGQTYTIDFADAIEDNNEGNPMGDYAFTFSTGDHIDTMQVSGYVLDASNLEPIKGIMVGLYSLPDDSASSTLPDSVFRTKPFERISRTDSRGHFIIKGIANGRYKVFALKDQDQSFCFNQKSEMIGFNDDIVKPWSKPDIKPDTVWHDSIHYDSVRWTAYTHFYPDDIILTAFTESGQEQHKLKEERPIFEKFSIYFTAPADTLPVLHGLNFNSDNAFIIDASNHYDTLTYWIKDSLIYNLDTLEMTLSYLATDTLGQLVPQTDTLMLASKLTKEKLRKQQEQEYEDWVKEWKKQQKSERKRRKKDNDKEKDTEETTDETTESEQIPPMPENFMDMKTSATALSPNQNFEFTMPEPVDTAYLSYFHFSEKIDSLKEDRDFILKRVPGSVYTYRLYAEWEPGATYELTVDTGAFVNIYGKRTQGIKKSIQIKSLDSFSTLFVNLQGTDSTAVIELLNNSDKVVHRERADGNTASFYFVSPGIYYLRLFCDRNGNGVWDPGEYDSHLQAEEVYYYPKALELKAKWDVSQTWNPTATPLYRQKPEKITKQKPDKEKSTKNKNKERLEKKQNRK